MMNKLMAMNGKDKCEFLKGIRKRMAELNGIPYEPRECTFKGDCSGTCPFCEKEAAELLTELKKIESDGGEIKTDLLCIDAIEEEIRNLPFDLTGLNTLLKNDVLKAKETRKRREELMRLRQELIKEELIKEETLMGDVIISYDEDNLKEIKESYELLCQQLYKNETIGEVERTEDNCI